MSDTLAINEIIRVTARYYAVNPRKLFPYDRRAPIARARQVAMYLVSDMTGYDDSETAWVFQRDRSTVCHARNRVMSLTDVGDPVGEEIEEIRALLEGKLE